MGTGPPTHSRAKLFLAFAAIYVLWGSTYLAIRLAIDTIPPFLMAGSRFLVAGAVLYAFGRPGACRGPPPASGGTRPSGRSPCSCWATAG